MKTKRKLQQTPSVPMLIERTSPNTRFIEFPEVQGRTVDKIQMSTSTDHHAITIDFRDKTSLVLNIEPCFQVESSLRVVNHGNEEITQEWPPIRSATQLP